MGCWNHTCAVTNLPVLLDDEVVVVLLKESGRRRGSSLCYPSYYATPIPLTFEGKYDEYGSVKECHGAALDIIVDSIRDHLHEMDGEGSRHDVEIKKDNFDIKQLFAADHEGRLAIEVYGQDPVRIKHMVILKEVYDGIINDVVIDDWDPNSPKTTYATLKEMYPQYITDLKATVTGIDDAELALMRLYTLAGFGDTYVNRMLSEFQTGLKIPIHVNELLINLAKSGADDSVLEGIIDNAIQFLLLSYFYESCRMSFFAPSGMGSQESDTDSQVLRAKLTIQSANNINRRNSGENPYITSVVFQENREYNPLYGDDSVCKCGHSYYRHFDSYEHNYPCGCKYCECFTFEEQEN